MTDMEKIRLTAEAFFELSERNTPIELIGGEIIVSPSPVDAHQVTVLRTSIFLHKNAPTGQVRFAPLDVQLDEHDVLQPDIFWVSDQNEHCRLVGGHWVGAPDLVIEVLSPSTASRDYRDKYDLYEKHGIREYWIMDSVAHFVEVFNLTDASFIRLGVFESGTKFTSAVLNDLVVPVDELFES